MFTKPTYKFRKIIVYSKKPFKTVKNIYSENPHFFRRKKYINISFQLLHLSKLFHVKHKLKFHVKLFTTFYSV